MCLYGTCSDLHQETFLPTCWFLLGFILSDSVLDVKWMFAAGAVHTTIDVQDKTETET